MMSLLLWALQTNPYSATIDSPRVKGTTVEFSLSTNLPDKAVVTLYAILAQYEYSYEHDRLTYVRPDVGAQRTSGAVAAGKVKSLRLDLPANGVYGFDFRFDPGQQAYRPKMQKEMGDHYDFIALDERTIAVGVADTVFAEMLVDNAACRDVLKRCREVLEALDKIADGEESEMAERAKPHMKDLTKLLDVVSGRIDKTLVNGTYKYVQQVLSTVGLAAQFIERLAKAKKNPKLLEPTIEDTGKPVPDHGKDTPPPTPIPGPGSPFLNFGGIRDYIERADVVRLREVLLWLVRFSRLPLERPDGAEATVKAIDSTLEKLQKGEPNFEEWATLKGGDKLVDVPTHLRAWLAAKPEDAPKLRADLESILDAFDKKLSNLK